MVKVVLITAILLMAKMSFAQTVSVQINELKSDKGICEVCLFSKAEGFPDESKNAVSCIKVKIKDKIASASFKALKPGYYAVVVYHDENNNGELDTNFLGIPKEGIGVSNNVKPKMGKPKFDAAKFALTADKSIIINIKY